MSAIVSAVWSRTCCINLSVWMLPSWFLEAVHVKSAELAFIWKLAICLILVPFELMLYTERPHLILFMSSKTSLFHFNDASLCSWSLKALPWSCKLPTSTCQSLPLVFVIVWYCSPAFPFSQCRHLNNAVSVAQLSLSNSLAPHLEQLRQTVSDPPSSTPHSTMNMSPCPITSPVLHMGRCISFCH